MKVRIIPKEEIKETVDNVTEIIKDGEEIIQDLNKDVQEIVESTEELTKGVNTLWETVKGICIKIVYGIRDGIVSCIKFFKGLFKKK